MKHFSFYIGFLLLGLCLSSEASELKIQHHELVVNLDPATHSIVAQDTIQLAGVSDEAPVVYLSLNPNLEIEKVLVRNGPLNFWEEVLHSVKRADPSSGPRLRRTIEIHFPDLPKNREDLSLKISYRGEIKDPPRSVPGLRFVRPDKTNGHIGDEGIYLTSETSWYPDILGSLATFYVQVTLPKDWRAVTHGKELSFVMRGEHSTSEWRVQANTESLTLAANRFKKQKHQWRGIEIATYLFPEDNQLADQYLDAVVRYLELYTELLGPYPFPKFAVVENFFPSGLGLPSFTLLGSRVIKRGYTQAYSLGHEIVHSWIGNSVLNRFETGNWVEGMTTYLANYYFEERFGENGKAMAHRQRMMVEYSLYSQPKDEYPVGEFHHKENRLDNAIGYQKTAMIFHMLRRQIGERAFFQGLRQLVSEYAGRYAVWAHLQRVFEDTSGMNLSWFFRQWVESSGAPMLAIPRVRVQPDELGGYWIRLRLSQGEEPFRISLPVIIHMDQGKVYRANLDLRGKDQWVSLWVPAKPLRLTLDPKFEVFRRLKRSQIPPMLNLWVTDQHRAVAPPLRKSDLMSFQAVLNRIRSQKDDVVWLKGSVSQNKTQSVLAFGSPDVNASTSGILGWCGSKVQVGEGEVRINGESFSGNDIVILVSCANPEYPDHVGTAFWGTDPEAVSSVARLLFFYGWDSYLIYRNGKVIARGSFSPEPQALTVELQAA